MDKKEVTTPTGLELDQILVRRIGKDRLVAAMEAEGMFHQTLCIRCLMGDHAKCDLTIGGRCDCPEGSDCGVALREKQQIKLVDRILMEADEEVVDEIVLHDVTFHIERMSDQSYWMGFTRDKESILDLNVGTRGRGIVRLTIQDDDVNWDEVKIHEG